MEAAAANNQIARMFAQPLPVPFNGCPHMQPALPGPPPDEFPLPLPGPEPVGPGQVLPGQMVGIFETPGQGGKSTGAGAPVGIEDVVATFEDQAIALRAATAISNQRGEAVAIIRTPVYDYGYPPQFATAANAKLMNKQERYSYAVVTLDPAIAPRFADRLTSIGFAGNGLTHLVEGNTTAKVRSNPEPILPGPRPMPWFDAWTGASGTITPTTRPTVPQPPTAPPLQ